MSEGATTSAQETAQSEEEPAELAPLTGPASVWPVVILPAAVIAVAAIAGYLAGIVGYRYGELVTLAIGTATATALVGLVTYQILGRRRSWSIASVLGVVAVLLLGLGMVRLQGISPAPISSQPPPSASAAGATRINAGRQFTQELVGEVGDFRGADLRGAHLTNLNLQGIDFSGANAAGASFEGSRLDRTVFRGADLGGAVLDNTCLRRAVLAGADLTGARAYGADVSSTDVTPDETDKAAHWPARSTASTACE
jgi:hypothetical protein